MNTTATNRRKVNYVLIRDHKGNICYAKVGDPMPLFCVDKGNSPIITGMEFFAAYYEKEEQYYIVIELSNGNRELLNIDHVEDYQLEPV